MALELHFSLGPGAGLEKALDVIPGQSRRSCSEQFIAIQSPFFNRVNLTTAQSPRPVFWNSSNFLSSFWQVAS